MIFNIKGDTKEIEKDLNRVQKKQIPFASAMAINTTLFKIMKAEKTQLSKKLDRPTPFTMKGFKVTKAKKHQLWGSIEIQPNRWKYLKYQVDGGIRKATTGKPILIPAQHLRNKYGNLPKNKTKKLIAAKKKFFYGTPNGWRVQGNWGIWERMGRGGRESLRRVVNMSRTATYDKAFPFIKIADGLTASQFRKILKRELGRAYKSSRRGGK